MRGSGGTEKKRTVIYCIVPRALGTAVHEKLHRHFSDDPSVEVVVEARERDRRRSGDRRVAGFAAADEEDRRRIRGEGGRRVGERRAAAVAIDLPALPRSLRRYAAELQLLERLEPSDQYAEDQDTARLVTRIQGGDDGAFVDLYLRFFNPVYSYLQMTLGSPAAAEDVTQQVFLNVLGALPRYERRSQPFRAWLFRIVRNQALTELRKQKRIDLLEPSELERKQEAAAADEDPAALDWITDRELLMFVERLPLAQRQVLMLRFLGDLTDTEIAEVVGRTPTAVRMLQSRALRLLRERLTAVGRGARPCPRNKMRTAPRHATVIRARRWALSRH